MQLYADDGSAFVTVEFEPQDVRSFARSWPCFPGPDRVCFTFERSSGDLVDMEPLEFDGPEALVGTFNRSDLLWSEDGRRTLLVWYLAERTAREITEDA